MKLKLYPWQEECLDAWSAHGSRGIVNVVTGAGKTVLALAAMDRLTRALAPGRLKVKIVVPTTSLLSQWRDAILEFTDSLCVSREEIGYYCGSRKDSSGRAYMIYVINSARYAMARHIINDLREGYSVLLIADECHHYTSGENKKIFDFLPFLDTLPGQYYSLGLSATPQNSGYESVLVPALGGEIYRYGFSDAAKKNTISPFAVFQIAVSFDAEEMAAYVDLRDRITLTLNRLANMYPPLKDLSAGQFFGTLNLLARGPGSALSSLAGAALSLIYQRRSLVFSARSRLSCACRLIHSLDSRARIILFGERIEQADQIYRLLSAQHPGQAGCCHSGLGKQARRNALERFRNGETRILVSCRALDEGFDVPSANVGIVLSSATVERQRIQRLGRILRRQEGKDISSLYYLYVDGSVEEPSFFPDIPGEAYSCSLSYSEEADSFTFPEYEKTAIRVLQWFRKATPDTAVWDEAKKCLLQGMIRPDWLLGSILGDDIWEEKIRSARTTRERNYWVCMRQMGKWAKE